MKRLKLLALPVMLGILFMAGCTGRGGESYNPTIDPADFVNKIDNQYYSLTPGSTFTYQSETEEGIERNELLLQIRQEKCWVLRL